MFNLPEVGEDVKVTVKGTVKSVIQYNDGEKIRFAVLVATGDGDEYEFIVPGDNVDVAKPGFNTSITYNPYVGWKWGSGGNIGWSS